MLYLLYCSLLFFCFQGSVSLSEDNFNRQETGVSSLQRDLEDLVDIIPYDDIRNLTEYYYASDTAMRNSYNYLRDEGFNRIVSSLQTLPLVEKLSTYFTKRSVNLKKLAERMGSIVLTKEECDVIEVKERKDLGGINSFVYESLQLSSDELTALFLVKLENSSEFSKFLENLNAIDYEDFIESCKKSQKLQELYFELYSHGVDVMDWAKSLRGSLGY